jgi:hypothetical protein
MPLVAGALRARPNLAQIREPLRVQHPVPDRPWPPWLTMVIESPSPTPSMSLQPAPVVRLPSPCFGLAVSRVVHVKSRARSALPCSRSRHRATSARACVRLRAVRRRDSVYARLPPRLPPLCALVSLAIARASRLKSPRTVRARCACCSYASSCVLRTLIIRLT